MGHLLRIVVVAAFLLTFFGAMDTIGLAVTDGSPERRAEGWGASATQIVAMGAWMSGLGAPEVFFDDAHLWSIPAVGFAIAAAVFLLGWNIIRTGAGGAVSGNRVLAVVLSVVTRAILLFFCYNLSRFLLGTLYDVVDTDGIRAFWTVLGAAAVMIATVVWCWRRVIPEIAGSAKGSASSGDRHVVITASVVVVLVLARFVVG